MAKKQRYPFGPLEDVVEPEVIAPAELSVKDAIRLAPDEDAEALALRLGVDVDTVLWQRECA